MSWLDNSPLAPALSLVSYAIAIFAILPCAYLLGLGLAALVGRLSRKAVLSEPVGAEGQGHIAFVVPAHNEQADIEETLRGLIDTVDDNASIHIVADNCSDKTADVVRAFAAAPARTPTSRVIKLLERRPETLRAKGYAL